jgi:hypothetical protein
MPSLRNSVTLHKADLPKQKEEALPKYTTAGLKKIDIATVEKKDYQRPYDSGSAYTNLALKKVNRNVSNAPKTNEDDDQKSLSSPLPKEFSQAQRRLSKIDIGAVENKFKSKPPLSDNVGSTYTNVRLSKIDVSLAENKYKNKNKVPLDDGQEQESKPPTAALKKVDIEAVESKQKNLHAPPMELSKEFSVKRLSRVDIAAVENKAKDRPHEPTKVAAYTTAGLKKVNIQSVEQKTRPPPTALSTEMSSRSLTLRKVDKNKKHESISEEGEEEPVTFLSRASLKKVNIEQVEKSGYKGEESKLQTVALKKVEGEPNKKPPAQLHHKINIEDVEKRAKKERELAGPAMLPVEFSPKRLSHTEPTSPKERELAGPAMLPVEFSPKRLSHIEPTSPKHLVPEIPALSLEFSPNHLQHKVNIEDVEKRAKKERELAGPTMLPAEFSPKLLSPTQNKKLLVSPSVLPKEIATRRSELLHLPDLQSVDYDEDQEASIDDHSSLTS